jgi:glutamate-ammonia-ligase adenylyltransferase
LEALGWIVDGRPSAAAQQLLLSIRAAPDPEGTLQRLTALAERVPLEVGGNLLSDLVLLAGASRGLWDSLLRHPEWLVPGTFTAADPRLLVQRRMIEIALADLNGRWDLGQVVTALSDLADEAVATAYTGVLGELGDRFPGIERLPFSIIALGKWGGRELNYASDIDLLFVYEPAERAPDDSRRMAQKLASALIETLAAPTAEGIAFRVDADLRPEGGTGPLVRTLDSYRAYYERWGEPWEFQALLKARPAGGDPGLGARFISMTENFVWPPSISPENIRLLRQLKARAEEAADPDDIKRAPGGIRDIEFSIQLLQLIHGRADPELRAPGTQAALAALTAGDYVRAEDADALLDSYRFLRKLEHRLQLWQLTQTHRVPSDRQQVARAMGYRDGEESATAHFETDLRLHRSRVRHLHELLYYRPLLESFAAVPPSYGYGGLSRDRAAARLQALGFLDLRGAAGAIENLTAGLSRRSRLMQQLLPLMVDWLADTPNPDLGLNHLAMLVAASPDSAELTGTLRDRPIAAQRLCRLLGSSRMVGGYLDRIPEFLPRLADDRLLVELPVGEELSATALERMKMRAGREERMGSLRRLVRRRLLRVAAADLLDMVGVERVQSALTDTADAAAGAALWTAAQEVGPVPMAIVAMGKWGGRELGYASDLDVIYVTGGPEEVAAGLRLAAEFASVVGSPTADGSAYRVDSSLRPEGKQGSLARSLDAYRSYYEHRAEPWELLALGKARPVCGDPHVSDGFAEIADRYAFPEHVEADMVRSIRHIKARVERERLPRGEDPEFHLKLGKGGLSDIEFLVQLWQLRLGRAHPELRTTSSLAGVKALSGLGVLSEAEADHLTATYILCTRLRNRLFLQTNRAHDAFPIDGSEQARLALSLGYEHRTELREEYRKMTRRARRIFEKHFYED